MREQFMLDPEVVFLNHGSFGACPIPVFEAYQNWQRELERQPVDFLMRRHDDLVDTARGRLAEYIHAPADDLTFVTNATAGINMVARSINLQPGDEVLASDHEYGAIDYTWQFVCEKAGAHYIRQPIPVPLDDPQAVIEQLWQGVTPRTRIINISHITSPTALIFPVAEICRRAREAGILTMIDGAHAPGQIPVDLSDIQPDFYTGNCHKWMCAPKGVGFLYVRPEHQDWIEPLVISWGWLPDSTLVSRNRWQGTQDIAACLSVPAAIDFLQAHDWPSVQARCHDLSVQARERISALTGIAPIAPESMFSQMFTVQIPTDDISVLKTRLLEEYHVEVPALIWNDLPLLRISIQAYNTPDNLDILVESLARLIVRRYTTS